MEQFCQHYKETQRCHRKWKTIVIPDMISGAEIDDLVLTEMSKMKVISS